MTSNKQWKRPQDVVTFRTSDPREMLGKYMPKHAVKTWTEDFRDEDTGEVVSIERNQIVVGRGYISQVLSPLWQGGGYKAGVLRRAKRQSRAEMRLAA